MYWTHVCMCMSVSGVAWCTGYFFLRRKIFQRKRRTLNPNIYIWSNCLIFFQFYNIALYYNENAHLPTRRSTFHSAGVLLPGRSYEAKFTFFQWYTVVRATHHYFPPLDYFTRILSVLPLFISDFRAIVHEPWRSSTIDYLLAQETLPTVPSGKEEHASRKKLDARMRKNKRFDFMRRRATKRTKKNNSPKYISDRTRLILK